LLRLVASCCVLLGRRCQSVDAKGVPHNSLGRSPRYCVAGDSESAESAIDSCWWLIVAYESRFQRLTGLDARSPGALPHKR